MKSNSLRLIIVEDNENDIDVISEVVDETEGVDLIKTFKSGVGVVDFLHNLYEKKNLVVFSDLNMPNLDGFDLLNAIKKSEELKHIPIFILSSSAHEDDVQKSYDLGVNSYFVKNPDFDKFEENLKFIFTFLTNHCKLV